MKKLTACVLFVLVSLASFAQIQNKKESKQRRDSIAAKRTADSIYLNEPVLTRNDVLDIIAVTITGYKNQRGQFVRSRFSDAIMKDDHFNGDEANVIIDYAVKIISEDMNRIVNEMAAKRKKESTAKKKVGK